MRKERDTSSTHHLLFLFIIALHERRDRVLLQCLLLVRIRLFRSVSNRLTVSGFDVVPVTAPVRAVFEADTAAMALLLQ